MIQGTNPLGRVDDASTGVAEMLTVVGEDLWPKIIWSLVLVLALLVLRRLVLRLADPRLEDNRTRYQWAKWSAYTTFLLSLLFLGWIWLEGTGFRQIGTFLGLVTAGLALALRDLVANLAGWLFIIWRNPFDLGDRIQIAGHAGDVVDLRIFQFTLLEIGNWVDSDQSTGRIIHVPNSALFREPLANYTADFEYLWNEVPILITFESDWRKAKEILERIAADEAGDQSEEAERSMRRASRKLLIFYNKLTPTVYLTVKDSGVLLTVRYLCKPRARRGTSQAIWEAILDAFHAEADIDLAYPTRRVFYNPLEGKEDARAPLPDGWSVGEGGRPPPP